MAIGAHDLKLVRPTDFDILEALESHGRNVAPNLAEHLERDKDYINTRLPVLTDFNLVRKIGPSSRSGLYEITDEGRAAVALRDQYDPEADFEAMIQDYLENQN